MISYDIESNHHFLLEFEYEECSRDTQRKIGMKVAIFLPATLLTMNRKVITSQNLAE